MSPPEWRECRSSTSDAKYLLRHDGAFAIVDRKREATLIHPDKPILL